MTQEGSDMKGRELEEQIVRRTVRALLDAGYVLSVDDGDAYNLPVEKSTDFEEVLEAMMNVDIDGLYADKDGKREWIRFVYGNDGWDVIQDYTIGLEALLVPIFAFASIHEGYTR
jgi:hypothetical protein